MIEKFSDFSNALNEAKEKIAIVKQKDWIDIQIYKSAAWNIAEIFKS